MPEKSLRVAIVGAGGLLGKALNDQLAASAFSSAEFVLLDDDETLGKLVSTGDEVRLIQSVEPDSFDRCDFTFFAGNRELTKRHWKAALKAGSRVIDLSGELQSTPGMLLRAPWVQDESSASDANDSTTAIQSAAPDLQTRAVVSAHPVAMLLALISARSQHVAPIRALWTTLLQPASEYGQAALEELHQQTANLLSFQSLPTEVFGGQAAFSLAVSFGGQGQVSPTSAANEIRAQFAVIAPAMAHALALQVIQAPVFHGYAISIGLEFAQAVRAEALMRRLAGLHVQLVQHTNEFQANVQAVEEDDAQILTQPVFSSGGSAATSGASTSRFWLWVIADNLKLAAQNGVACAVELNRLRPRGTVQ